MDSFEGAPSGWVLKTWRNNPNAGSFVRTNTPDGESAARIHSTSGDDALYWQQVAVKPNTNYELTGIIKTQNVVITEAGGQIGANLSIWGTREVSNSVAGTRNWTKAQLRFNSVTRSSVKIAVRLGHHGSTTWNRLV